MAAINTDPPTIEWHPEDGGCLAEFLALPRRHTWGETYEASVRDAEEALAVDVETLIANGGPIPAALLTPLAGSGRGLWGEVSAGAIAHLREEWGAA